VKVRPSSFAISLLLLFAVAFKHPVFPASPSFMLLWLP
jgi:hypothetical protein